jgi:predicted MPP superfamily phosphohydrolase
LHVLSQTDGAAREGSGLVDKVALNNHSLGRKREHGLIHSSSDWATERHRLENSRYWISPAGRRGRWRNRLFSSLLAAFGAGIRLTPLFGRGRRNALDLKLVELKFAFKELPRQFDGYRILHVSDTHLDVFPALVDAVRKLLGGLEIDLLALTGDVHGSHGASIARSAGLLAEALDGVRVRGLRIAVLGNHDPVGMADLLDRAGFEVLINRSLVLQREGESLRITGLDDVNSFYSEAAQAALADHAGEFRIALVHSPEVADYADEAGYALYLCGHTHGGQICLPGGRPLITQLKRCRHAARGLWRQGGMAGYTSCGLGVSGPPVRFNSRGEVALITLRRETGERPPF